MEQARWIDWRGPPERLLPAQRLYFGHETCERLAPPLPVARELARRATDVGAGVTLVTPFVTDRTLPPLLRLVEDLLGRLPRLEVLCSDWGVLASVCRRGLGTPVIGRLLAAQPADPRLRRVLGAPGPRGPERRVRHLDGTDCRLTRTPPPDAVIAHYRGVWTDRPRVVSFFQAMGVRRCEVSDVAQGLELTERPDWSYSLHVSDVPVSVMRHCPGQREDLTAPPPCRECPKEPVEVEWRSPALPAGLFRRDNALYYRRPDGPASPIPSAVDRVVMRRHRG